MKKIDIDAVLTAYIEESVRRGYGESTIGQELVAVRNALDQTELDKV